MLLVGVINMKMRVIDELEDQLLDYKVEKIAGERIKKDHKGYSEKEVFGPNGLDDVTENEDDGWE